MKILNTEFFVIDNKLNLKAYIQIFYKMIICLLLVDVVIVYFDIFFTSILYLFHKMIITYNNKHFMKCF